MTKGIAPYLHSFNAFTNTNLTRFFLTYKVSVHQRQFDKKLKLPAPTKIYVEITVAISYLDKLDYSIWDCCFAESSEIFNDITCLEQKEQKNKKNREYFSPRI